MRHLVQHGQQVDAGGVRAHCQFVPFGPDVDRRRRRRHLQAVLDKCHPCSGAVPCTGASGYARRQVSEELELDVGAGIESQTVESPRQVRLQRHLTCRQRHPAGNGPGRRVQFEVVDTDRQSAAVPDELAVDVDRTRRLERVDVTPKHFDGQVEALQ